VGIKFSTSPKEATMYRRKRRILKSLVLGFAVAAFAAPAALAEPRGAGNYVDPLIADAVRASGADDRALYRGTSVANELDPLVGDAIRAHQNQVSVGSDDRSMYRGTTPQLDPTVVGSPDDRNVYRGVQTDVPLTITFSPAIRGEQVKTFDRPSFAPISQPSVTGSTDDGFQWADASLGAVSTLALVLLMGAAGLMIRHQRRRIAAY
jgi:hypothetical protein